MSKQKDAVLHIIQSSSLHLTAEEIFLECKKQNVRISIATIYRNLGLLCQEGQIRKVSMADQPDRYDKVTDLHCHAICDRCHQLEDIEIPDLSELIEKTNGIQVTSYDICVHHICAACRKKEALHIY